jgi:transcriptional regulator GlxA family with amidase domain
MTAAEYSDMSVEEATRHSMEAHERLAECDDLQMYGDEHIVIVVYPGFTALDLAGPQYFLGSLMGATVHLAATAPAGTQVTSDTGLSIVTTATLDDIERCDVLLVPGSGGGLIDAMTDAALLAHLRRLATGATIVSSVCTGSLILGAAGLLQGRRATSHWVMRNLLSRFGAQRQDDRVVQDGPVWTSAGVTAGIDLGLAITQHLRGQGYRVALELQAELVTPNPPDLGDIEQHMAGMFALTALHAAALAPSPPG